MGSGSKQDACFWASKCYWGSLGNMQLRSPSGELQRELGPSELAPRLCGLCRTLQRGWDSDWWLLKWSITDPGPLPSRVLGAALQAETLPESPFLLCFSLHVVHPAWRLPISSSPSPLLLLRHSPSIWLHPNSVQCLVPRRSELAQEGNKQLSLLEAILCTPTARPPHALWPHQLQMWGWFRRWPPSIEPCAARVSSLLTPLSHDLASVGTDTRSLNFRICYENI